MYPLIGSSIPDNRRSNVDFPEADLPTSSITPSLCCDCDVAFVLPPNDKLIFDQLPNVLSEDQKQNKIRNIIQSMSKKDKTITNRGTSRYPKWEKV